MLAKEMLEHAQDWDELTPYVIFDYNIAAHASTGFSPAYMTMGREPRLPVDHAFGHVDYPLPTNAKTYVNQLRERLAEAHRIVQEQMDKTHTIQKAQHDQDLPNSLAPL